MKRRDFILDSCKLCVSLSATGIVLSQLSGCSPALPVFKTSLNKDIVNVPLSSFVESNLLILRDLQMSYDVLLVKKSEQEFLDSCAEYCSRNIVNRLRLLPFEEPSKLAS